MEHQYDKASYRNKGGLLQKAITQYKIWKNGIHAGKCNVIKSSAEFHLTDGAYLEIGNDCVIQDYAYFLLTKPRPKIILGNGVVIGRASMITGKNLIQIGDDVIIGSFVQIVDVNHGMKLNGIHMKNQSSDLGSVIIGDDVWIGSGAKILMNVNIGNGAVIGANSVVTRDVPKNAVVAGVPARVIRYRDDQNESMRLKKAISTYDSYEEMPINRTK